MYPAYPVYFHRSYKKQGEFHSRARMTGMTAMTDFGASLLRLIASALLSSGCSIDVKAGGVFAWSLGVEGADAGKAATTKAGKDPAEDILFTAIKILIVLAD